MVFSYVHFDQSIYILFSDMHFDQSIYILFPDMHFDQSIYILFSDTHFHQIIYILSFMYFDQVLHTHVKCFQSEISAYTRLLSTHDSEHVVLELVGLAL